MKLVIAALLFLALLVTTVVLVVTWKPPLTEAECIEADHAWARGRCVLGEP